MTGVQTCALPISFAHFVSLCHILVILVIFLFFFLKNKFILFIYFWLRWVFVAARGLSRVVVSGGYSSCGAQASHCGGFSLRSMGSRHVGFHSCGTQAQ